MTTQKEIAKTLDRAAARAGSYSASGKQVWFLAGLIARSVTAEIDHDDWMTNGVALSKAEASNLIEFYLSAEKNAA